MFMRYKSNNFRLLPNLCPDDNLDPFYVRFWSMVTHFRPRSHDYHGSHVYQLVISFFPSKHISFSLKTKDAYTHTLFLISDTLTWLSSCLVSAFLERVHILESGVLQVEQKCTALSLHGDCLISTLTCPYFPHALSK